MIRYIKRAFWGVSYSLKNHQESFLWDVTGLVHVGANTGQERDHYRRFALDVLWIEPIPEIFEKLKSNTAGYSRQRCVRRLVTDCDDQIYNFKIANNNGASSSIFHMKGHKQIWPDVDYTTSMEIAGITLPSLLREERLDPSDYSALVLDVQGAELCVLRGASPILANFKYVKVEVADFDSYDGGCTLSQIKAFMNEHEFSEFRRSDFVVSRPEVGNYYNIVFKRIGA